MAELSPILPEQPLCSVYVDCLTSYQKFLLALHAENCNVVRLGQVNVIRILDEFGRMKTWGDQAKATFPPGARGSLDDTLRKSPELEGTVETFYIA
jgi:exonuclease III